MRFLVAVDGSTEAQRALTHAAEIARAMDASVTVATAVNPSVFDLGGSEPITGMADANNRLVSENIEDAEARAERVLEGAEGVADEVGITIETALLYGPPAQAITEFGAEFDGIFVGHRGRSERAELMLGSVAKSVVERASVPVTVVR